MAKKTTNKKKTAKKKPVAKKVANTTDPAKKKPIGDEVPVEKVSAGVASKGARKEVSSKQPDKMELPEKPVNESPEKIPKKAKKSFAGDPAITSKKKASKPAKPECPHYNAEELPDNRHAKCGGDDQFIEDCDKCFLFRNKV